jgi:Holliday junction resolvase RusA-like endonuclease
MADIPLGPSFFVHGNPTTKGSLAPWHRWGPMVNGKATCRVSLSEETGAKGREWRALIATGAKRAMRDAMPFEGPIAVALTFYFDRPTSQRLPSVFVHTRGRHDIDKLARMVLDAMTDAAVWRDDGQVSVLAVEKRYVEGTERPGVLVTLEPLREQAEKPELLEVAS